METQTISENLVEGKVITKSKFTDKIVRLKIKNIRPVQLSYKPGQYILLRAWDNELVPYYIFDYNADINAFELAVNIDKGGTGANYIKSIGVGKDIEYTSPKGNLTIDAKSDSSDIYFITQGTYVSPLIANLHKINKQSSKPNISLFWGVKDEKELFLVNSIYAFSTSIPTFSYTIFISEGTSTVAHRPGRVVDAIQRANLDSDAVYYVCGQDTFVGEVSAILNNKGIDRANIVLEKPKPMKFEL